MGLQKVGNKSVYKNDSFGITSDWLVSILCIIYAITSVVLGEKNLIGMSLYGFNVVYAIVIIIVYWVLRNKQSNNLSLIADSMLQHSSPEKFNHAESKLTSFRKLMLGLSNVPVVLLIIYFVVIKYFSQILFMKM